MMKVFKIILFILVVFFIDQAITESSGIIAISIIVPAIIYISTHEELLISLIIAFALGFLSDISALRLFPVNTIFIVSASAAVYFLSKKYLEFKSILAMILVMIALYVIQIALFAVLYAGMFSLVLVYSFLANVFLGVIVFYILIKVFKGNLIGE